MTETTRDTERRATSDARTLAEALGLRAERTPDDVAFRFLPNGEDAGIEMTCRELRSRAHEIATRLLNTARPGARALLVHQPGLDYIAALFGCLQAGLIAVPCYPPRPRDSERLAAIVADCSPAVVIADRETTAKGFDAVADLPRLVTDGLDAEMARTAAAGEAPDSAADRVAPDPTDIALIQYSSGSTGDPKGVMISHANALANLATLHAFIGGGEHRGVVWLPPYHDMGLVGGILLPIYAGFPMTLMRPAAFLQKPGRWLRALARERATVTAAPNFAYDRCVDAVERARLDGRRDLDALDLSHWRIAINGAEVVQPATLDRFASCFAANGFRPETFAPCYGLAETTLIACGVAVDEVPRSRAFDREALERDNGIEHPAVTLGRVDRADHRLLAPSGRALGGIDLRIVDPATGEPRGHGLVGEIWLRGPSIAAGYWGQPARTEAAFQAITSEGDGPFLRTGDLGFLDDGELFVTGRAKDLIVLRGRNHCPTDIERTAESSHPDLQPGASAAFALPGDTGERLGLVAEMRREARHASTAPILAAIRTAIGREHGIAVHAIDLVRPGAVAKTSSGKIARHRNRERLLAGTPAPVAAVRFGRDQAAHVNGTAAPQVMRTDHTDAARSSEIARGLIAWLRTDLGPRFDARLADERRSIPPHIVLALAERGFFGLQVPSSQGGLGLSHVDTLRVIEQLAAIDLTLATMIGGHNSLGLAPIVRHATPAVRAELVGPLARGAGLAAYALTERGAGSNPRALATRAVPTTHGGWRLYGRKFMSGSAAGARSIVVTARVEGLDELGGRRGGLTAFVVRQGAPGLVQGPEALTMGLRAMVQNSFVLDGVEVSADEVLGDVGAGFEIAQEAMMLSRIGLAALALGGMKRCVQLMVRYASRRRVATGLLIENPVAGNAIGDIVCAATAVEALAHAVAARLDRGEHVPEDPLLACKIAGSELLGQATDTAVQLLGARGYLESNPAARLFRDARAFRILEGPTEALTTHLGTRARDAQAAVFGFLRSLGAADVAERTARAIAAATEPRRAGWDRWLEVGALVEAALLHAAGRTTADARVEAWTRARFEARLERLSRERDSAWAAEELAASLALFEGAIGNVELPCDGEEVELDELLRREVPASRTGDGDMDGGFPSVASRTLASPPGPGTLPVGPEAGVLPTPNTTGVTGPTEGELLTWLTHWIARETGTDASDIRPEECLAGVGLDSLLMVQLAVDLEARIGRSVTEDELHEAANLGELVASLVAPPGARPAQAPAVEGHSDIASFPEVLALQARLRDLAHAGRSPYFRSCEGVAGRTTRIDGRVLLNFGSYDYLGLGGDERVRRAAQEAIGAMGTSVSASRLAGGERPVHRELEGELAQFLGCADAVAYVGGHATNVATIGHLIGPGDAFVGDALIHNSIAEGAERSGARRYSFPHDDWRAANALLERVRGRHRRVLVAVEGVYSADGDIASLPRFVEIKRRHGALLFVDEAHSLGVLGETGRGIGEHFGIARGDVDLWMGTLSKTLASCGGYIAGSRELVEYLRYTCGGFVYSVGMPPGSAAAALAALRVLGAEPERVGRLRGRANRFREQARAHGLDIGRSAGSAVVPIVVGGSARTIAMAARLEALGIFAVPMIAPSVDEQGARLRFFVSASHTDHDVDRAAAAIAISWRETGDTMDAREAVSEATC